ncbi:unnamed protein product [Caenorhabditis nigoni]
MDETPKNRKFGLLKFPFALREEVIRNMEFMDAFHFSTLSKRSKRLVHNAKLRTHSITFCLNTFVANDKIIVETIKDIQCVMISLADPRESFKRKNPDVIDGRKLANLINEPSDDYKKKLSAHLLFIFHFKETKLHIEKGVSNVHFERNYTEPLTDFFLWDVRKTFDFVSIGWGSPLFISSKDLKFILETIKSNQYYLGKQINILLKQWINGQVTDLESLRVRKRYGSRDPADVILDGIVTMAPTITYEQAKKVYSRLEVNGQVMNIQRKVDGQLATVLLDEKECSVVMWNEKRLAELGN